MVLQQQMTRLDGNRLDEHAVVQSGECFFIPAHRDSDQRSPPALDKGWISGCFRRNPRHGGYLMPCAQARESDGSAIGAVVSNAVLCRLGVEPVHHLIQKVAGHGARGDPATTFGCMKHPAAFFSHATRGRTESCGQVAGPARHKAFWVRIPEGGPFIHPPAVDAKSAVHLSKG